MEVEMKVNFPQSPLFGTKIAIATDYKDTRAMLEYGFEDLELPKGDTLEFVSITEPKKAKAAASKGDVDVVVISDFTDRRPAVVADTVKAFRQPGSTQPPVLVVSHTEETREGAVAAGATKVISTDKGDFMDQVIEAVQGWLKKG
jgi:hypothetical protein